MSNPVRKWRVTAIEWLSHTAVIEASTEEEARAEAQSLWEANAEQELFHFSDSGFDDFYIEEG
jgi:hypothetical protein